MILPLPLRVSDPPPVSPSDLLAEVARKKRELRDLYDEIKALRCPNQPLGTNSHPPAGTVFGGRVYCAPCAGILAEALAESQAPELRAVLPKRRRRREQEAKA